MPELKPFGIVAPIFGVRQDTPSILLSEAQTSDSEDAIKIDGELQRAKKRLLEFSQVLPDTVIKQFSFERPSVVATQLILFTRRDIVYRDKGNDRYQFINKLYLEGTISAVNELTASFELTFDLPTGQDLTAEVQAGDFIQIEDNTSYHTGVTWFEIESVDNLGQITCAGSLPTGFDIPTGGQDYTIRKTFNGSINQPWSVDTFNEEMVATNYGVDAIIVYTGAGQVTDASCKVNGQNIKCRRVKSYKTRFLYGWPIINGTEYPFRFLWSGAGDRTDCGDDIGSDSSFLDINEGAGTFIGFGEDGGYLTLWKEEAIVRAWLSGDINVFNKSLAVNGVGTPAPDSLVTTHRGTYFFGQDNTFRLYDGVSWRIISGPIQKIVDDVNGNFSYLIQGIWNKEAEQINWAIPFQTSETNDKVLVYNVNEAPDNWDILALDVACWGEYTLETSYIWDTLPFPIWNDWAWDSWNERTAISGNPLVLLAGYDGYIYRMYGAELDDGSAYTGYSVLETSLGKDKRNLFDYKRIHKIQLYLRPESSGTFEIEVKRDNEASWQAAGSVDLVGDQGILIKNLPMDFRGKSFKIKPTGANRWRLIGMIIWFRVAGKR